MPPRPISRTIVYAPLVVGEEIGRALGDRPLEKGARARMAGEERQRFVAHRRIVGRLARDPLRGALGVAIERRLEQLGDALPAVGRHAGDSLSSRNSQARASAHRRFTVAGEKPSASAASSMLKPAK